MFWGKSAKTKKSLINKDRGHLILEAPHPSPFSASKGFFGCRHFSKCNEFMKIIGKKPINWDLNRLLDKN